MDTPFSQSANIEFADFYDICTRKHIQHPMEKLLSSLILLLLLASCGQRQGSKTTDASAGMKPGWSVLIEDSQESTADETDEMPDYVNVSRTWKDIPDEEFIRKSPTKKEIDRWKKEFEKVHSVDSVWYGEFGLYKDAEQYICDVDLTELLHGRYCEEFSQDDRRTEWRLLQYEWSDGPSAESELDKILRLRGICEDLLDRELGSQMDINLHSWLVIDLQEFYIRLLQEKCLENLSPLAAAALKAENAAFDRLNYSTSAAYQKIDGSPSGFDGSSYPRRVASFGEVALNMEINALEPLLRSLITGSLVAPVSFVQLNEAEELVDKEYGILESTFKEDKESEEEGLCYSVKVRKEAMEKDRHDWHSWLLQREKVSRLLSSPIKESYDNATLGICRHKLIMLKNRYESGAFLSDQYLRVMLPYECVTTEQILSHNYEKLLEEELSK